MSEDDRDKLAAEIARRIGFTQDDVAVLADAVAQRQASPQRPDVIKTAGEAIAWIAGAAAAGGLVAMLVAAATGKPTAHSDKRELGTAAAAGLLGLAVLISAAIAVVLGLRDGWSPRLGWAALAILPTWGALCTGWRVPLPSGTLRILAVGVVFMLVAIPGTLVASALVLPQRVRLCLSAEPGVINGLLIAMTKDQAFLMPTDDRKTVIALPGDSITRADTGDTSNLPACPNLPPPGNT